MTMTATLRLTALALLRITILPYSVTVLAPPPFPWWCVYTRPIVTTCAYIRRRFCRQSSVVDFIPSELVMSAPTRVSV